jgi:hypothetical protein
VKHGVTGCGPAFSFSPELLENSGYANEGLWTVSPRCFVPLRVEHSGLRVAERTEAASKEVSNDHPTPHFSRSAFSPSTATAL